MSQHRASNLDHDGPRFIPAMAGISFSTAQLRRAASRTLALNRASVRSARRRSIDCKLIKLRNFRTRGGATALLAC